jgi:hypothetical protein
MTFGRLVVMVSAGVAECVPSSMLCVSHSTLTLQIITERRHLTNKQKSAGGWEHECPHYLTED